MNTSIHATLIRGAFVLWLGIAATFTHAQVPQTIAYQGYLTSAGAPVNGVQTFVFSLYTAPSAGTLLWSESQSVTVTNGNYNVLLGSGTLVGGAALGTLPFNAPYFLGVKVGTDVEMSPRAALAIVPYAYRAVSADTATIATTATTAAALSGTIAGSQITGTIDTATISGTLLTQLDGRYGPATNVAAPQANTVTAVDTIGDVGLHTSITIGADGLPVISYWDYTNLDLKVAKCGNAACSSSNTITAVDTTGDAGWWPSITIGADGLPVISYYDATNGDLKVAKCGNAACSASNTITAVDTAGAVGRDTSITIGADGLPVISYYDATNGDLKVAKCGNAACSAGNTITTVDTAGDVGRNTSITIGADGRPVISYHDFTNLDLKVTKCGNAACSAGNTINAVDTTGDAGFSTSITIGADGLPVISYWDLTNTSLKVARCGNAACSAANTLTAVDTAGSVPSDTSITIGADGLPVISYYEPTNHDLKVAKCGNAACSAGNTITAVDTVGDVGHFPSITIGADGLPVISYYDTTNADLKVAKCANAFCSPYFRRR